MYRLSLILVPLAILGAIVVLPLAGRESPPPASSPEAAAPPEPAAARAAPVAPDDRAHAAWRDAGEEAEAAAAEERPETEVVPTSREREVEFTKSFGDAVFVPGGGVFAVDEGTAEHPVVQIPADEEDYAGSNASIARDSGPIRAAFYYPWFPQAWTQNGVYPFSKFEPSRGYYSSADREVVRHHIEAMEYGNIDAGISSWWGPADFTDENFRTLLRETRRTELRWAVYYEAEGVGNPSVSKIRSDLYYLYARYALDPSYLRIDGRFAVFVFGSGDDGCEMAERWREAAIATAYVVLKAFPDYARCESQPDSWHVYNPFAPAASVGTRSFSVSPGYAKIGDSGELERDLERWKENVAAMARSGARLQLIVSFNEWGEGSSVESSPAWASPSGYGAYLDVLHEVP